MRMNPGPKHAYEFVDRRTYEAEREERLMVDDLPDGREILMRYSSGDESLDYYAADYIVCIRGVYRASRKIKQVLFEAVRRDGSHSRTVAAQADSDDFIVRTYPLMGLDKISAEIGYFICGPESLNLQPEDFIRDDKPLEVMSYTGQLQLL